ncbi:MAG: uracil phosphoribosyltransferase [Pseudomonadota bacterium]|jgi:uracil phosphoribosyltransferase
MNKQQVTIVTHPLVQHKLTLMRMQTTQTSDFRRLLREVSMLLAYEVTRDLPVVLNEIQTPIQTMMAPLIEKKITLVSILRAGNGLLEGMLELLPWAKVGHIGLYRDPQTLTPVEYYFKMPPDMPQRDVIVVDPMLATGNSAAAALSRIKTQKPLSIKFVCLIASPEGVDLLTSEHPDVPIYTAGIDERLNDHGYIVPGLGDAGDRIYGTV